MSYRVTANISGKRIITTKKFVKKQTAQAYADATNKYRKGARARVVRK